MPGLALGVPVVAARMAKFNAEECQRIIRQAGVRNVFFPPTALRMLKAEGATIAGLRSIGSGGEPLGAEMLEWGRDAFGLTINEFYGQTECNLVAASVPGAMHTAPGALGRAVPGFALSLRDGAGKRVAPGEIGEICVQRGTPAMMLRYHNNPEATREKFFGDWLRTGDLAKVDEDGF